MIKVEIGQYRRVEKGSLNAFFSLLIHPMGIKINNCSYFVKDENKWFNFPSKEIEKDGKKEYIPLVSIMNKDYMNELKVAVLLELEKIHGSQKTEFTRRTVCGESSTNWDTPF